MADSPLFDPSTDFGARVAAHLRDDLVVWFTTVSPAGVPMPSLVWFLRQGDREVVMYSQESTRTRNLAANPHVALNFRSDERGEHVVVLNGEARVDPTLPPAHEVPAYLEKYARHIDGLSMTPEQFAADYRVPVRITLQRVRGF